MSGVEEYRDHDRDAERDANMRSGYDNDDALDPYEAGQLDFDDDDRLPWLESGKDEYVDYAPDSGRLIGMFLLGLVALAAIVGGIWWSSNSTPDATLVADRGTIKAPAQPYKQAPRQPGGKTFEGTGDTAFAVSEGKSHAATLGEAGASPVARPSVDLSPTPPVPTSARSAVSATPAEPAAASAAAGTLVQVGAYSTRASAQAAWSRLSGQYSALSGQRHQIVEGQADIGAVFRLQALPGSASAAQAMCSRLKGAGLACQVK